MTNNLSVVWMFLILCALCVGLIILLRRHIGTSASIANRQAQTALIESEKRFRVLIEAAPVGVILTRNSKISYVNPVFLEMFRETSNSLIGTPTIDRIAPESREVFIENVKRQAHGEKVHYEIIGLRKDGSRFPLQVVSTRVTELSNEVTAIGFIHDISERKQVEEKLKAQNEKLNTMQSITLDLLNHRNVADVLNAILLQSCSLLDSPFGLVMLLEGDILTCHAVSGYDEYFKELRMPLKDAQLSALAASTRQPQVVQDYSNWVQRNELHDPYHLKAVVNVPIIINEITVGIIALGRTAPDKPFTENDIDAINSFVQLAALALDNARLFANAKNDLEEKIIAEGELQQANKKLKIQLEKIKSLQFELREQAIRDPLTGLYNRRHLNEMLQRELARAKREQTTVSFVMIDIDHFKKVNDTLGHETGDKILQELAAQLLSHTRSGDIICRYGGEEFLVILPDVTAETSFQIAEKWRNLFERTGTLSENKNLQATISCGIAEYPSDGLTDAEVISNADKALYIAKRTGRNRVVIWSGVKDTIQETPS